MVTFNIRITPPVSQVASDIEGDVKEITRKVLKDFIQRFGKAAKSELRGKLETQIPVRTGKLKSAFRITQMGNKILIGFESRAFYWRFQRRMRQQHIQSTITWIERRAPEILQQSVNSVKRSIT